ncbi:YesL family protein [Alteribacillus sp. HJP-4]|uniref:YesL family protein n=1 Tax=Alteribacillus sp. HJP-4 TaxID=2775394 RepID=UPI0035CD3C82
MEIEGKMGGLYRAAEWVTRLAYVNGLWILFSAAGLFILGFFPATAAMFAVIRKWITKEPDVPVFRTFWKEIKKEFLRANGIGYVFVALGYFIYVDIGLIQRIDSPLSIVLLLLLGSASILLVNTLLFTFPMLAQYELPFIQYFKYSFLIGIASPFVTVITILGLLLWYVILHVAPALSVFFGGSTMAFLIMWFSLRSFDHIEQKHSLAQSQQEMPR